MDAANYTTLTRQTGLLRELQVVANNIANISTTGFKGETVLFSEYVHASSAGESTSMAHGTGSVTNLSQGALTATGNPLDLAIEGDGFFQVAARDGPQLTRAGSFVVDANGLITAPDGAPLLDVGGAPIALPLGVATISVGADGTVSADDAPIAQIGVWATTAPGDRIRSDGVRFRADTIDPVERPSVRQGFTEQSNVDPMRQVARMIEVQRAYEWGQSFLDREDERLRGAIRTLGE